MSALRRPPLSHVAGPLYDALIAAELAGHRAFDALEPPSRAPLDDLTVVVKTFERPRVVRRFVASVRRRYPALRILVADDSRTPEPIEGAELLALPYDVGLSAGRNAALARVDTPFFLLADDDFVFFRETRIEPALDRMRGCEGLDVVGGRVLDLPLYREHDTSRRRALGAEGAPPRGTIAGLERREVVRNFFLGRTEPVRTLGWDPALKLVEHADFFGRARGVLTVAYDPTLAVLHAKTPFDARYAAHREDVARYHALLALKWRAPQSDSS